MILKKLLPMHQVLHENPVSFYGTQPNFTVYTSPNYLIIISVLLSAIFYPYIKSNPPNPRSHYFFDMMYRSLAVFLALTALVAAKDVTIVVISELNAGRKGPPYDGKVLVKDVADDAVLFDVMKEAQHTLDFSYV